jgi:tetratricopeptide (TPR) repeat protein
MGNTDGAIEALSAVTQRFPSKFPAWEASRWYRLGLAYKTKGDWDGAIRTIQKALELGGGYENTPPMSLSLAEIYGDKGAHEKQIQIFEKAIEVRADKWWVCQYLAETCKALGDHTRAKDAYEKALKFHPTWAQLCLQDMGANLKDSDPNARPFSRGTGLPSSGDGVNFIRKNYIRERR